MELSTFFINFAASPTKLFRFDHIVTHLDYLRGQSCTGY